MPTIDPRLLAAGLEAAPQLIELFRDLFVAKHPDAAVPTSEEVIATFQQTFTSSLAIDDALLAAPDPPH